MIQHFGLVRQYANLKDELLDASDRAMREGCLIDGPYVQQFEAWLRRTTGARHAITVHSGTQALEIIARHQFNLLDTFIKSSKNSPLMPAPKVRLPNLTYPATLNAFINAGWEVELVDTDKNGLMVRDRYVDDHAYECIVGLFGARPEYSLDALVDGAQHWLVANGQIGSGMAISFDPTKNLASSGNGGAIVTNHDDLHNFVVNYKNNGKLSRHITSGTNSKMSEQDCAQILVRTRYIDSWQKRRADIASYWCEVLNDLQYSTPGARCLSAGIQHHAHQKFVIYTEERDALLAHLLRCDIEAKIHYPYTLSELPLSKDCTKPDMLSTSVMLSRGVLSLPMYPELTDAEVEYIANTILTFYKAK